MAAPLTEDRFEEVFEVVRANADELGWLDIPWIGDLWEGRRVAAEEHKPMFLWAMNGHPLGTC